MALVRKAGAHRVVQRTQVLEDGVIGHQADLGDLAVLPFQHIFHRESGDHAGGTPRLRGGSRSRVREQRIGVGAQQPGTHEAAVRVVGLLLQSIGHLIGDIVPDVIGMGEELRIPVSAPDWDCVSAG